MRTRRKTNILLVLVSIVTVFCIALNVFFITRVRSASEIDIDTKINTYSYEDRTSLETEYLLFDFNSDDPNNLYATFIGIKSDSNVTKRDGDGTFHYDTLEIPERVMNGSDPYTVKKVGKIVSGQLTELVSVQAGTCMTHDPIMAIIIPDTVEEIATGAFRQFPRLEYFQTPFVGTVKGATDNDKPLASMFSKKAPFYSTSTGDDTTDSHVPNIEKYKTTQDTYVHTDYVYTRDIYVNSQDAQATNFSNAKMLNAEKNISTISRWYAGASVTSDANKNAYLLPQNLKYIKVTNDTEFIDRAFFELNNVETIILPKNMTSIDVFSLMAHCISLTHVEFPTKCGKIGTYCLSQCISLRTVRLPSTLVEVPKGMFSRSTALETVELPASIITIQTNAFQNCSALKNLKTYTFDSQTGEFVGYATGSENGGFNIPQSVKTIQVNAFIACTSLKEISISSNALETIELGAFQGCSNVETVTLPFIGKCVGNSGTAEAMFGWIFGYGSSITQYFGSGKEDFQVFDFPSQLKTIIITNETLVSRGSMSNLKGVKTVTISQNALTIEVGAFEGCISLEDITVPYVGTTNDDIHDPTTNNFATIFGTKQNAVYGSQSVPGMSQVRDNYVVPPTLKTIKITNMPKIRTYAFYGIDSLENLIISNNTTYIENAILYGNSSLVSIELPFVGCYRGEKWERWWYYHSYQRYNSLGWIFSTTQGSKDYGVKILQAFGDGYTRWVPSKLETIIINDESVIGPHAFQGFSKVKTIKITNTPSSISGASFKWCSGLTTLELPYIGSDINSDVRNGNNYTLGYIFGTEQYEGSYAAKQYNAYYYIPNGLTNVIIHGEIKVVPEYAFNNMKSLESVSFDSKIKELRAYAFNNCENLTNVTAPLAEYTRVGDYAFCNCQKIGYIYQEVEVEGKMTIQNVIPITATEIGKHAFENTAISNVDLSPDALLKFTKLGDYAFAGCVNIESVSIPTINGTSVLQELGTGVFARCSRLATVELGENSVSPYLFEDCILLSSVDLTGKTTSVPAGLFYGCTNLETIVLDPQTTEINKQAFYGCSSLTSFEILGTLKRIGAEAFCYCTGLEYMFMPRNVETIEAGGFEGCDRNKFHFYVLDPESDWPEGWVNNWNCKFPVYIYGSVDETSFIYDYVPSLHGYEITGVKEGRENLFSGILVLPATHNGVEVVSIGENAFSGLTKVKTFVLPASLIRIKGQKTVENNSTVVTGPFNNGQEIVTIFVDTSVAKAQNLGNDYENNPLTPFYGNEANWLKYGYVYYRDYWTYSESKDETVKTKVPFLLTSKLEYEVNTSNAIIVYDGTAKTPTLASVKTKAVIVTNDNNQLGLTNELPTSLFNLAYSNNINAGTGNIKVTLNQTKINSYNLNMDTDHVPAQTVDGKNSMVAGTDKLRITGDGATTFTISKKEIYLYPTDGIDNVHFESTYGVKSQGTDYPWANKVWNNENTQGFYGTEFTLTGTLTVNKKDAGVYHSANSADARNGSLGDFRWEVEPVVRLNGKNVTDNFKIILAPEGEYDDVLEEHVGKLEVFVDKLDVFVDWSDGFWANSLGESNGDNYKNNTSYTLATDQNTSFNITSGTDYYVWQYAGADIKPTARAVTVNGTVVNDDVFTIVNSSTKFTTTDTIIPDYVAGRSWSESTHSATASLKSSKSGNYRLKARRNDGATIEEASSVYVRYFITKKVVNITINLPNYLIGYDDDDWHNDVWDNTNISGLNEGSFFKGYLKTTSNAMAEFYYNNGSIVWQPAVYPESNSSDEVEYVFYRIASETTVGDVTTYTYTNENDCYDLRVSAYVNIHYNKFINIDEEHPEYNYDHTYFAVSYLNSSNVLEYQRIKGVPGFDGQSKPITIVTYPTDGAEHYYRLFIDIDFTGYKSGPTVLYKYNGNVEAVLTDTGVDFESLIVDAPNELGSHAVGFTITRKNFETAYINTRLDIVKSNIEFDEVALSKEYDGLAIDPNQYITKKPLAAYDEKAELMLSNLKFLYYKATDTSHTTPIEAPIEPGDYILYATTINNEIANYDGSSEFFNALNRYIPFTIRKRVIYLDITGEMDYNGNNYFVTYDLMNADNDKILDDHRFTGVLMTNSRLPGVYYGTGLDDEKNKVNYLDYWNWTINWTVTDTLTDKNVKKYYEVEVIGRFEINELVIEDENVDSYGDPENPADTLYFDGLPHHITVNVTGLRADANPVIYYSLEERNKGKEQEDLLYTGSPWSTVNPTFYTVGSYDVWYKILATNYTPYYGHEVVVITDRIIEYQIGYTTGANITYNESDNKTTVTVQYDGIWHEFIVDVDNPSYGVVEYSLDETNYTTDKFSFFEVVSQKIYYRITAENYATVTGSVTFVISEDDYEPITTSDYQIVFVDNTDESTGTSPHIVQYDGLPHSIRINITNPNIVSYDIYYRLSTEDEWSITCPTITDITEGNGVNIYFRIFNAKDGSGNRYKDYYKQGNNFVYGTISITPRSFGDDITVENYVGIYDGKYHTVTITGLDQEKYRDIGYKVYYATDPNAQTTGQGWSETPLQYKDFSPNAYPVYVKISAPNYSDKYFTVRSITINKSNEKPFIGEGNTEYEPLEIQYLARAVENKEIPVNNWYDTEDGLKAMATYHDGQRVYSYYLATNVEEWVQDEVTKDYVKVNHWYPDYENKISNPSSLGTYAVVVELKASNNCTARTIEGIFKIVPRVVKITYFSEREYTGTAVSPEFKLTTGTKDVLSLSIKLVEPTGLDFENVVNLGQYKYKISIAEDNKNYVMPTKLYDNVIKDDVDIPEDGLIVFNIVPIKLSINVTDTKLFDGEHVWSVDETSSKWSEWINGNILTELGHKLIVSMETKSYLRMTYVYPTVDDENPTNIVKINHLYVIDTTKDDLVIADLLNPQSTDLYVFDVKARVDIVYETTTHDIKNKEVVYNGANHTIDVKIDTTKFFNPSVSYFDEGLDEDDTVESLKKQYGDLDKLEWQLYSPAFKEVGKHPVLIRIESDNYETIYVIAYVIIKKADLEIEFDEFDVTYDALVHQATPRVTAPLISEVAEATLPSSVKYYPTKTYTIDDIKEIYGNNGQGLAKEKYLRALTSITDAGEYYVVAMYYGTNNYNYVYKEQVITIKQKDIHVALASSPRNRTKSYDGKRSYDYLSGATFEESDLVYGQSLVNKNKYGAYRIQTNSANYKDGGYGQNDFEFADAGLILDGKKDVTMNYHPVIMTDINHIINKVDLTFSVAEYTTQVYGTYFDGATYVIRNPEPTITLPNKAKPELYIDNVVHYKYYYANEDGSKGEEATEPSNVGVYYVIVTFDEGTNYNAYTKQDRHGIVEITPKIVDVKWKNLEVDFTGGNLSPTATFENVYHTETVLDIDITVSEMVGEYYVVKSVKDIIKAGNYSVKASIYAYTDPDVIPPIVNPDASNYILNTDTDDEIFIVNPLVFTVHVEDTSSNTENTWEKEYETADFADQGFPENLYLRGPNGTGPAILTTGSNAPRTYLGRDLVWNYKVVDSVGTDYTQSILFEATGRVVIISDGIVVEELNGGHTEINYDGQKHYIDELLTVVYPDDPEDYELLLRFYETDQYLSATENADKFGKRDKGTYTYHYKVISHISSVAERVGSVTLKISMVPTTAMIEGNISREYNGEPISNSSIVVTGSYNKVVGSKLIYTYYPCDQQYNITGDALTENPIDAGYYKVVVTTDADTAFTEYEEYGGETYIKNYEALEISKNFEITRRTITINVSDDYTVAKTGIISESYKNLTKRNSTDSVHMETDQYIYQVTNAAGQTYNLPSIHQLSYTISTNNNNQALTLGKKSSKLQDGSNLEVGYNDGNATLFGDEIYVGTAKTQLFSIVWNVSKIGDTSEDKYKVSYNYDVELVFEVDIHYPDIIHTIGVSTTDCPGATISDKVITSAYTQNPVYANRTFDQSVLTVDAESSVDNIQETYTYEAGSLQYNAISSMSFILPGLYTVNYSYRLNGFRDTVGTYTISITYTERQIAKVLVGDELVEKYKNQSKMYDGTYVTLPEFEFTYPTEADKLKDDYDINDVRVIFQEVGFNTTTDKILNAGDYIYTIIVPASTYYNATYITGTYKITKAKLVISNKGDKYEIKYAGNDNAAEYNIISTLSSPDPYFDVKVEKKVGDVTTYVDIPDGYHFAGILATTSGIVGDYTSISNTVHWNGNYTFTNQYDENVMRNYSASLNNIVISITTGDMNVQFVSKTETFYEEEVFDENLGTTTLKKREYTITPTMILPKNASKVQYSTDGVVWQDDVLYYTDPGIYTIHVKVFADNYEPVPLSATLTINRAKPTVEIPNLDKVYDGQDPLNVQNIASNTDVSRGDGSGTDGGWHIYYQEWDDDIENWAGMGTDRPVNVGKYKLVVDIPDTSSKYTGTQVWKEFTISPRVLMVTWSKESFTYNGLPQHPTATLVNAVEKDKIDLVYNVTQKTDGDPSYTLAGKYGIEVLIDNNDNYTIKEETKTTTYTIDKRAVVIKNVAKIGNYDETKNAYEFYYNEVPADVLADSEKAKYAQVFIATTHPDKSDQVSGLVQDYDSTEDDVEGDYFDTTSIKTISYVPAQYMSQYIKDESDNRTPKREGIGMYEWTSDYTIYDYLLRDVTNSYTVYYRFDFRIDYAEFDVLYEDYNADYDGELHSFSLTINNSSPYKIEYAAIDSDDYTTTVPMESEVKKDDSGNVVPYQYKYRVVSTEDPEKFAPYNGIGKILIKPREANLAFVRPFTLDKEYDGLPVTNPNVSYTDDSKNWGTIEYKYVRKEDNKEFSKAYEVGTYTLTAAIKGASNNYKNGTTSIEFEIKQREIVIEIVDVNGLIKPVTKVYDATRLTYNVTNKDVRNLASEKSATFTEEFTGKIMTKGANVGSYTAIDDFVWQQEYQIIKKTPGEADVDVTSNYTVKYNLTFRITPATIEYDFNDNVQGIVNGQEYFLNIQVTKPADYTIMYYLKPDKSDIAARNPKFKNRGTYTVYFEISANNYNTVYDEGVITITGASSGGYVNYLPNVVYNGYPYMSQTVDGKPVYVFSEEYKDNDGQQTVYYYEANANGTQGKPISSAPTDAGTYFLVVNVAGGDKYDEITTQALSFTINKAAATVVWGVTVDDVSTDVPNIKDSGVYLQVTYNGEEQYPYAYLKDISDTRIDLVVNNRYTLASLKDDAYDVTAVIPDSIKKNYIVDNDVLAAKFKILPIKVEKPSVASNIHFEYGEEYYLRDAEGNYILDDDQNRKTDRFGDIIRVYTNEDGVYYVFEDNDHPTLPTGTTDGSTTTAITNALYTMELDPDKNADVVVGKMHYVTITLLDNRNYMWDVSDDYDQDPYKVRYIIDRFDIDNQKNSDFIIKAIPEENIYVMDIGDEVTPSVKVIMLSSDGKSLKKEFVVAPQGQDYIQVGDELVKREAEYTHKNNKVNTEADYNVDGEIEVVSHGNFLFKVKATYVKRATPPETLELKKNSVVRFIEITIDTTKNNQVKKNDNSDFGIERTEIKQTNVYLGRIYHGSTVQDVLDDIGNESGLVAVFNNKGERVTNLESRFGTGYVIRLYNSAAACTAGTEEGVIDEITGIIFGDVNSDGLVNVNDLAFMQAYVTAKRSYDDGVEAYIAATLGSNVGPNVNSVAIMQAYISKNRDFNSDYLQVPEVLHAG